MNKQQVSAILASDPFAVTKAIVLLYSFQTQDERGRSTTTESNRAGFNVAHAKDASYWARWVLGVGPRTSQDIINQKVRHYLTANNYRQYRTLSGRFLEKAREVAAVYWRQLSDEADRKAKAVPF